MSFFINSSIFFFYEILPHGNKSEMDAFETKLAKNFKRVNKSFK
jgi:hypothetical protein